MREFEGVRLLESADDLLTFIKEDPLDRLLDYRGDRFSTVASMRALGVTSMNEYVKARRTERDSERTHDCTLAVVGVKRGIATKNGELPQDIMALCKAAQDLAPGRLLSWAGYEGLCVLATHPDAEVGEAEWFTGAGTTSSIKEEEHVR
ncbi:hypothetical protein [Pseudomonas sp. G(2018)]|uniref:hypothetical protein n=1 Tax=Pseudomonas sp. G(2018) TaxID=2502242 RepID=UPI0010F7327F|nr:hypothetical protein [Pseudomonas sp. G(2018)]